MKASDVVIVGGGPGGTICALQLLRRGIRPTIVERTSFPRFSIGESLTGECGNLLRQLDFEETLTSLESPVKRGVEVWGTGGRNSFYVEVQAREPEGLRPATTWQVLRSEFDRALLDRAVSEGARFVQGAARDVLREDGRVRGVAVETTDGRRADLAAEVVVDASGRNTFLARCGVTGSRNEGTYGRQIAIFAHVRGARRDPGARSGDTLIFYRRTHEWAWFIPVGPEVTSIGIVVPTEYFRAANADPDAFFRRAMLELNPALTERLEQAVLVTDVHTITNYSYEISDFVGPGFVCVGDAHRFTDPIFSFGVFMTAKESTMVAEAIAGALDEPSPAVSHRFADFAAASDRGQRIVSGLIDVFWKFPLAFQRMANHTHRNGITDIFAGRMHHPSDEATETVMTMQRLLAKGASRRAAANASV